MNPDSASNFENPLTPEEEELKRRREQYEENAERIAEQKTSFVDKLIGGELKKDDVIRSDAELEAKKRREFYGFKTMWGEKSGLERYTDSDLSSIIKRMVILIY